MDSLGISTACPHSALQLSNAAQALRQFGERSSSGRYRVSVGALRRSRSTSSTVIPALSPVVENSCLLGKGISASRIGQLASERCSLSRLGVELMLRRMVRAEEEKSEKDAGEEPDSTNDSGHQLWIHRARNIQTTAQIFCSMMFWIVLFFVSSIWDNDKPVRYRWRDRGRRK